jgi:hypothetical protein
MIEGSGSRAGSGSIPLTNGSGSGRPKNMLIRIRNTAGSGQIFRILPDPDPLYCRPGYFPVLESCEEEEEYCEQPNFSWLKYGRICTVIYYFTHQFIGTDNHLSLKGHRGLALQCLPGSTVLCIQNPDVDLVCFFKPRKGERKITVDKYYNKTYMFLLRPLLKLLSLRDLIRIRSNILDPTGSRSTTLQTWIFPCSRKL